MPTEQPGLYSQEELRQIFERGLLQGLWSVNDIIRGNALSPVLPSLKFLEAHPQFKDRHFRDLKAFRRRGQTNTTEDT